MAAVETSLGRSIPADTPHAVSVSLPSWRSNVGYEEGEDWVVSRMTTGYPRFFINKTIAGLGEAVIQKYGTADERTMLFPASAPAERCLEFMKRRACGNSPSQARVIDFVAAPGHNDYRVNALSHFSAVLFPASEFKIAKSFWQHTGEGMSSRRAEHLRRLYDEGLLVPKATAENNYRQSKGPRRYRKLSSAESPAPATSSEATNGAVPATNRDSEHGDQAGFVEERFGRNLNPELVNRAQLAIKRRIAGSLTLDVDLAKALETEQDAQRMRNVPGFSVDDVYLYSCGMNAIYTSHRLLMAARGSKKTICFGFPYIDTLKLLEKFGPGCLFYGNGTLEDLDDLESRLKAGERYLALFCEFPSNPLLRTPNLRRIRALADEFDFAVVVDETIGNFLNTNVLTHVDVLVSSLTKIFSGDSNVMGGSVILNPNSQYYGILKDTWSREHVDYYWAEDAIFMERNSRDFVSRIERINVNAEAICELLQAHARVKQVYYPKVNPTRCYYDEYRTVNGGYGGLLSATFYTTEDATAFYDALDTEKGPSLGTNFTLASPFVLLAHYGELEWAAEFGVEKDLIRFSVGLERTADLQDAVSTALRAIPAQ